VTVLPEVREAYLDLVVRWGPRGRLGDFPRHFGERNTNGNNRIDFRRPIFPPIIPVRTQSSARRGSMRIRHYAQGKFYVIECPEGTRVVRRSEQPLDGIAVSHDLLIVPFKGEELRIPADPPELLPLLAESGTSGSP